MNSRVHSYMCLAVNLRKYIYPLQSNRRDDYHYLHSPSQSALMVVQYAVPNTMLGRKDKNRPLNRGSMSEWGAPGKRKCTLEKYISP